MVKESYLDDREQGRAQRDAKCVNAPARLSGSPKDLIPVNVESPQRIFLACIRCLLQPAELFQSVRGTQLRLIFQPRPPWSELGPLINCQWGPLVDYGAPSSPALQGSLGLMHTPRKNPGYIYDREINERFSLEPELQFLCSKASLGGQIVKKMTRGKG